MTDYIHFMIINDAFRETLQIEAPDKYDYSIGHCLLLYLLRYILLRGLYSLFTAVIVAVKYNKLIFATSS